MEQDILDAQDLLQAIERSHARTGKLIERFHTMAAKMIEDHGPGAGVSPSVVAPKEPPK